MSAVTTKRVRIIHDNDVQENGPREWCNAGKMYCWHKRYALGDSHSYDSGTFMRELACEADAGLGEKLDAIEYEAEQVWDAVRPSYDSYDDCIKSIFGKVDALVGHLVSKIIEDNYLVLPLSLYDHSGITISVGHGTCQWDSGQVGWIVCDKETCDKEWGGDWEKAEECLRAEVEVYDQYLTGDVYGFIVEEADVDDIDTDCDDWEDELVWEVSDSCWGFYGSDPKTNGMADHLGSDELVELACDAEIED